MKQLKVIVAIVMLCLLEGWALYLGFNGLYLNIVLVIIAGLAGYELKGGLSKK